MDSFFKRIALRNFFLCSALGLLSACGYTLQTSQSPFLQDNGVRRLYVAPVTNRTYKPGVESVLYNSLVKKIASTMDVQIVRDPKDADATLQGVIREAEYDVATLVTSDQLAPVGTGPSSVVVATEYQAKLLCLFTLSHVKNSEKQIWGKEFERTKLFPANTQLKVLGTTSALINDSEFDRALSDLSDQMVADVSESLLSYF